MNFKVFFNSFFITFLILFTITGCSTKKQRPQLSYKIYSNNCAEKSFNDIVESAKNADVVLFGEGHTDRIAHKLELKLLKALHKIKKNDLVLSLEMFERDVQTVLDEYLEDIITERHFIWSSRAWRNYRRAYRPMIQYSKKEGLKVVAANAPRRYVNLVSRKGKKALDRLSPTAKKWIAPLPYGEHNRKYIKKIEKLNEEIRKKHPGNTKHKFKGIDPDAQLVWDITMAHSIIRELRKNRNALVYNVNGKFHSEDNMGIPDLLRFYKKDIKILIITAIGNSRIEKKQTCNRGDYIILTALSE